MLKSSTRGSCQGEGKQLEPGEKSVVRLQRWNANDLAGIDLVIVWINIRTGIQTDIYVKVIG